MTSPRLPAISGPGFAMSCSAMLAPNLARARFTLWTSAVTRNLVPGRAAGCDGALPALRPASI